MKNQITGILTAASLVIAIILLAVHLFRYGYHTEKNFVLVIGGTNQKIEENVKKILAKNKINFTLRSMDKVSDNNWQVVFEIISIDGEQINKQKIIKDVEKQDDIKNVSLLAPNVTLPI